MAELDDALNALAGFHPLVLEGPARADHRDPMAVAWDIAARLGNYWAERPPQKPLLLLTQGDPFEPQGIAALTREVATSLSIPRGLAFLDEDLDPNHRAEADRENVILEVPYRTLALALERKQPGSLYRLDQALKSALVKKNADRELLGKPPLPAYFHRYGRLQEVTKAAARLLCGGITVAHSATPVHEFSVTSLYTVGLDLGLSRSGDLLR
ncbi:MAG: shikimate kinase [Pseudomonadales bacterium]|nr:shikimate kinase [Pseudomonadales bacterium]